MFEKLADFRPFQSRFFQSWYRVTRPYQAAAANDNAPITSRPGKPRRVRPPELTCHWLLDESGTRLVCRWQALPPTRAACEDLPARRAKHRAARKRSNRFIKTIHSRTVRT